ncbi:MULTISPECIES: HDOD domain-containing protein [Colwellia]|uniref:Signal transduction protein with HDOD/GAF domains n=1 Tax=Colwellia marinimaniae TaxID=1513592 RepID=A0ABQ0MYQ5_9GAMM|nr:MULTISPECIES: HDOD domain-containing protein [Colwellia]GAW97387.1 signal transduction protein with HDOD/GAF domains [Colwellia marinimaniae]
MNYRGLQTTEQWIELIANSELPAITSTAKMLDKFANDDKSSLPKLSEAILHDQGLSSCLLKVANNIQHISINKVTTVSRATVVLGIQTVKNICLTVKLVSSLLATKTLDINVYEKLTQLMANSFYAGMLAKMMVPTYSDEVQEEVYLAAMLYRIGESAFWSAGGDVAKKLANYQAKSSQDFKQYCQQEMGTSFTELSKGLASTWNLSDLLIKALDQPTNRTDEVKIIYFADKLSAIIAKPEGSGADYQRLLADIADIMNISVRQLTVRVDHTREQADKLLSSYGAEILIPLIKSLPASKDFEAQSDIASTTEPASKDKALLAGFIKLTNLMKTSKDLNEYLQLALENIALTFAFDRSSFLLLVDERASVKSRLVVNNNGQSEAGKINIDLKNSDNVIARVISTDTAALINDHQEVRWRDLITQQISDLITHGAIAFVPVKIAGKAIGVICLQLLTPKQKIATQDFQQVCSFIDHLNMCLTMIKYR